MAVTVLEAISWGKIVRVAVVQRGNVRIPLNNTVAYKKHVYRVTAIGARINFLKEQKFEILKWAWYFKKRSLVRLFKISLSITTSAAMRKDDF